MKSLKQKVESLIQISESSPEQIYVALRLPEQVERVERVNFRTCSHDQGRQPPIGNLYSAQVITQGGATINISMAERTRLHIPGL